MFPLSARSSIFLLSLYVVYATSTFSIKNVNNSRLALGFFHLDCLEGNHVGDISGCHVFVSFENTIPLEYLLNPCMIC
jgi:hypothetical protein